MRSGVGLRAQLAVLSSSSQKDSLFKLFVAVAFFFSTTSLFLLSSQIERRLAASEGRVAAVASPPAVAIRADADFAPTAEPFTDAIQVSGSIDVPFNAKEAAAKHFVRHASKPAGNPAEKADYLRFEVTEVYIVDGSSKISQGPSADTRELLTIFVCASYMGEPMPALPSHLRYVSYVADDRVDSPHPNRTSAGTRQPGYCKLWRDDPIERKKDRREFAWIACRLSSVVARKVLKERGVSWPPRFGQRATRAMRLGVVGGYIMNERQERHNEERNVEIITGAHYGSWQPATFYLSYASALPFRKLTLCSAFTPLEYYYPEASPARDLVTFVEFHRLMGFDHIHVYVDVYRVRNAGERGQRSIDVLARYASLGTVTVHDVSGWVDKLKCERSKDDRTTCDARSIDSPFKSDCYFRERGGSIWTAFADTHELLVPKMGLSFPSEVTEGVCRGLLESGSERDEKEDGSDLDEDDKLDEIRASAIVKPVCNILKRGTTPRGKDSDEEAVLPDDNNDMLATGTTATYVILTERSSVNPNWPLTRPRVLRNHTLATALEAGMVPESKAYVTPVSAPKLPLGVPAKLETAFRSDPALVQIVEG